MATITVEELAMLCKAEMAKGNGSKKILISKDDEGNGYHELFFAFTPPEQAIGSYCDYPYSITPEELKNDYIVLG